MRGVQIAAQMAELAKKGINSFKFFLAYKGALMVTDDQLVQGLRQCKNIGALAQVRARGEKTKKGRGPPPTRTRICRGQRRLMLRGLRQGGRPVVI